MASKRDAEAELSLGDLTVLVTYQYYPGEPQTWTDPGCGPEVELLAVYAGEAGIPLEAISDEQQDKWIEKICELVDASGPDEPDEDVRDYDFPEGR